LDKRRCCAFVNQCPFFHAPRCHTSTLPLFAAAGGLNDFRGLADAIAAEVTAKVSAELTAKIEDSQRAVSTEVYAKINAGAMFVVLGGPDDSGAPLMCGTFVSETVALTAAHDDSIKEALKCRGPIWGQTVPPPGAPRDSAINLKFVVASADIDLDFAVLRLVSPLTAPAFIPLPPIGHVPVGNVSAGLVTLSIGPSKVLSPGVSPTPSVATHLVQISRVTAHHYLYSASTWSGDSGGALVVRSGFLVGMHIEAVSEYDAPARGSLNISPEPGAGKGRKRAQPEEEKDKVSHTVLTKHLSQLADNLTDHLSSISSSHGREGMALIVSLPAVRKAVEDAVSTKNATSAATG
jgi:hypothetical protein